MTHLTNAEGGRPRFLKSSTALVAVALAPVGVAGLGVGLGAGLGVGAMILAPAAHAAPVITAPAIGGHGGHGWFNVAGGAGGIGVNGDNGSNGATNSFFGFGGGGGGGAAGGGTGGQGGYGGGAAGAGGTAASPDGQAGGNAGDGGGGGGGGGYNGIITTAFTNTGALTGGKGGVGGSVTGGGGGGGGGAGGYGALITGGGSSLNVGTITGGAGGAGGSAVNGGGGDGGTGGGGVFFADSGNLLVNSGSISGGNGGAGGGRVYVTGSYGAARAGGVGVAGADLTIRNSGTISGGMSGNWRVRADAINFTGGANTLTLLPGSSITGNIAVNGGGSLLFNQTGGSATLANAITGDGSVEVQAGANTLTLTGTNSFSGGMTLTSGTLNVSADSALGDPAGGLVFGGGTLQWGASFDLGRAVTLNAGGGAFDTNGYVSSLSGSISGSGGLAKSGSGTLTLSGTNSYSGPTTVNAGTLAVTGATTTGALTNSGTLTVGSTGNLTVNGDVTNLVGGTINIVAGGTLTDALNNASTVNNAGTYNADVNNYTTGVINNSGTWNGDVLSNAGLIDNTGSWNGNVQSNAGTITLGNGSTITGNVANSGGTLALATGASATIGGDLSGGTVSMRNGAATEALTVAGTTSGPLTFNLDVNLATGRSDRLSLNGGTGTVALNYNLIGTPALGTPITVISGTNLDALRYSATGLSTGAVVASLQATPTAVTLVTQVNPSVGGTVTGFSVVQSLMGVVIDRPAPTFGARPEEAGAGEAGHCGSGGWARAVGGYAKGTASTANGISNLPSETRVDYKGLQVGSDWGCGKSNGGLALRWGAMAGINGGSTAQDVFAVDPANPTALTRTVTSTTRSDFSQAYAGLYLAGHQDGFGFNLQLRRTHSDFTLNDPTFFATGTTTTLNTTTLAGDISYTQSLGRGVSVTPQLGLGLSRTARASLSYLNGTLDTQGHDGRVAFIGATLRKTSAVRGGAAQLTSFVTGKVYRDFSPDVVSTFTPTGGGTAAELRTGNLGTYGEVSLGMNYTRPLASGGAAPTGQLGAALALTGQVSGKVHSLGLSARLRVQF